MTSQTTYSVAEPRPSSTAIQDISVVMVCMNNKGYLEQCLTSLYTAGLRSSFDVVVVDNGSTDGSQAMLGERFPEVLLIQNASNVGLSRASNQGIAATLGRYVLLLNDDTLVNAPSLDVLVEFLDNNPTAGAAGGRLLNPDGSFQAAYESFSTLREEFFIATALGNVLWGANPAKAEASQPKVVDWLGSACLLLRRKALNEVGLLDEEYFIYGDEADLQYRFQRAGWPAYYVPSSYTIHYGGRSMNRWRRRKMVYRGKMLFYRKNYSAWRTGMLRLMFGTLSAAKILIWVAGLAVPTWRWRAQQELRSNLDVVKLCLTLA